MVSVAHQDWLATSPTAKRNGSRMQGNLPSHLSGFPQVCVKEIPGLC